MNTEDLPPLTHKPMRPPRDGHIGEYVFAEKWEELMNRDDGEYPSSINLHRILYPMPVKLDQRHATVAASMICWLGTNVGLSFLRAAQRLEDAGFRNSFVSAWAVENRRIYSVNNNVRTAEHLLATEDHYGTRWPWGDYAIIRLPELSADDYEVLEHVAHWLGTDDGKRFCEECEAEIKIREDAVRHVSDTYNRSGNQ